MRMSMAGAGSALLIAAVSTALAQNPAPSSESGLEEVTVTARKRTESLQDIPVAVTALSEAQIERFDLTSFEKIAAMTPQLTVGRASSGSGAQISMRGIGSTSTSIGIEQSVATVIDGAYSGLGRVIYEGFFDLERVEILKGPQALFFGKNATAGVVSFTTADPGDTLEIKTRAGYEFGAERTTLEGVLSMPLGETFGVRIAVRGLDMSGGYYDNHSPEIGYSTTDFVTGVTTNHVAPRAADKMPGEEELLGRVTLKWTPSDSGFVGTLKFNYDKNEVNNNSWNYVSFGCANGFSTLTPTEPCRDDNFVVFQNDLPAAVAGATPFAKDGGLYNDFKSWNTILNLDYEMSGADLTSTFFYQRNENSWNCNCAYQTGPIWATEDSTWRAFSNETRLVTNSDGPLNGLFGVYYQQTTRVFDQNVIFAGSENSAAPAGMRYVSYAKNSETEGETMSAFGQLIYEATDALELAAGVRYIRETKDSYFIQPYVNPGLVALFVPGTAVAADQTFENWSPEATIKYKFDENVTAYAAYKTAYKSGGLSNSGIYSALSSTPDDDFLFEPEEANGYEVGLKTVLFDNQLRFNTTVYRYKYTNLQVDFFNSPTFAYLTINAGAAVAKGIETEFEFAPKNIDGLTMNASLNYNDAKYEDFIGPCYSGQSTALGCPSPTGPGGFPQQDLSGKPTSAAPEWTSTVGGYFETPLTSSVSLGLGANLRYSSEYLASSLGNPISEIDSYVTVDATVRIKASDDRWEIALLGKNLSDQQYFLGAQDAPATGSGTGTPAGISADQSGYGTTPRQVELQFAYRFK